MTVELSEMISSFEACIRRTNPCRRSGKLEAVVGSMLLATLPGARLGERVLVGDGDLQADVAGFNKNKVVLLPACAGSDLTEGMRIRATGSAFRLPWSEKLLGRVLDAQARPLDGAALPRPSQRLELDFRPPRPLQRRPIRRPLVTGVRAIDGLVTLGCGQRVGLFAGPGLGKSVLLGQIARSTRADCTVFALVGERGRELNDFIHRSLGEDGLRKSVVVCATSDAPAAERARALPLATAVAEGFRRQGRAVLLLADSLTRHARALREIALVSGEPPGRRGFPPSVFDRLARLIERTGNGERGSITAIYTVLTEGDLEDDPLAQEVKGLLDGHIVLDSGLAQSGCFPSVDLAASLSRLMDQVVDREHLEAARRVRALWRAYEDRRDLIAAGAYEPGSEPLTDRAIRARPALLDFIRQAPQEPSGLQEALERLVLLAQEADR